jgi:hypothetical protein
MLSASYIPSPELLWPGKLPTRRGWMQEIARLELQNHERIHFKAI